MARKITTLLALALLVGLATAVPPKGLRLPWATAKKVSAGAATGTVTSISKGVMISASPNPIIATGTIAFDTAAFKLWWSSSVTPWDTNYVDVGWGLVRSVSGDTVTLTGDSATIHTWGDLLWLDIAYADTVALVRDTANAALARRDTLTAGWGIDLAAQATGDDTITVDSATVHTWGDGFWLGVGDTGAIDTTAFHHDSRADTSETLFARTVNIDTTAGPAALNVAGNAWVRDTAWADLFLSYAVKPETTTNPNDDTTYRTITVDAVGGLKIERTQAGDDDKFSLQVGGFEWSPKAYLMKFAQTHSAGNDTDKVFTANGALGFLEYREANHLSLMNWDGFENVDTVHKDVSGNPARRAYNGFAWNDTGMTNDGCGFAGIWQYESTRVVAMAETASGGINSFVATVGSATGNFADTSYMSSTLGFYTTTNCQADTFKGDGSLLTGITATGDSTWDSIATGAATITRLNGTLDLDAGLRRAALVTDTITAAWSVTGLRLISQQVLIDDTLINATADSGYAVMMVVPGAESLTWVGAYLKLDSVIVTGEPNPNTIKIGVGTAAVSTSDLSALGDTSIIVGSTADVYATDVITGPIAWGYSIDTDPSFATTNRSIYLNWGVVDPGAEGRIRIKARLILVCQVAKFGGL